jgi:hypothetical protein
MASSPPITHLGARSVSAARAALFVVSVCGGALGWLTPARVSAQAEAPSGVVEVANPERGREDTLETARGISMGSGARATATGTSALAYNNANLALLRLYHVEAGFGYITGRNAFTIGSAVADSISNSLAAGFSFRGFFGNGRDYNGWDGRLGLGMALAPVISLGVGARYVRMTPRRRDDNDTPIGEHARGFTLDASATVTPIEWLHFSVLAYNLIDLDSALAPQQVGGSLGVLVQEFGLGLGADVLVDLSTFSSPRVIGGFGVEYTAADLIPIRLGYRRDGGRNLHTQSLGTGYYDSKLELDFALRHDLRARGRRQTELMLTVRYNVQ